MSRRRHCTPEAITTLWPTNSWPVESFTVAIFALDAERLRLHRSENFGAGALDLADTATSEVGTAKTGGKAEIVFDAGAETVALAAGSFALD